MSQAPGNGTTLQVHDEEVQGIDGLRTFYGIARQRWPAQRYIFRGQRLDCPLATSLERACRTIDRNLEQARERELSAIREFQRRLHHYAIHVPPLDHLLEWLAVMQHHGAPTRLLDWSYSIYVAAYFAVEYAREAPQCPAVVWMLDTAWCTEEAAHRFAAAGRQVAASYIRRRPKTLQDEPDFKAVVMDEWPVASVWPENPFRLNERLTIQKGIFVCVGDVVHSFEDNVRALEGYQNPDNLRRLIIPVDKLEVVLRELFDMNITQATLFPGLDGFARSLKINLAFLPHRWETPEGGG